MGLRVPAAEIDGTCGGARAGRCFSDALVSVGSAGQGGTGSFISADGLIVTNHHVALDAVRQMSSSEHDYLANGFVARERSQEIAGPDYEVWITRSCQDVSGRVLENVRSEPNPLARANKMRDMKNEIAAEQERALQSKACRCEVKEMFPDKTYVLFTFERLRDVRIVYVPPMCLGNFGGDTDNFEWPRHSADFTLLRAYVGPDGQPAEPSPSNVPYRPSKFLQASSEGVKPGDFVFLLGFPGHTMRYAPSARLAYSDEVAVPAMIADFSRKLDLIATHSTSRDIALKLVSTKKSLANEFKRSSGKRVMMRKLELLQERRQEEQGLIAVVPESASVLQRLEEVYNTLRKSSAKSNVLEKLRGVLAGSALLNAAHCLHEAKVESRKPDEEREGPYRKRNRPFMIKRMLKRLGDMHGPMEAALVEDACKAAEEVGLEAAISALAVDVHQAVGASHLGSLSSAAIEAYVEGDEAESITNDVFVKVAAAIFADFVESRDSDKALLSERDQLLAKLLEMQKTATHEHFYPDANGTLRISAGHVEGYDAADAVQHGPITTIAGLIDKHVEAALVGQANSWEFECPERFVEACKTHPGVLKTPVNCLYSTDTVGGNSGSPVLNAKGEFIAINFDRQRLGLMNEFKWSARFSRSIGVDVRYILWLVGTYDSAEYLVNEMTCGSAAVESSPINPPAKRAKM